MMNLVKQVRAAFSLLDPEEVQGRAIRPVSFGLVAAGSRGYAELEDFLLPEGVPGEPRMVLLERVHRAGDSSAPDNVDVVLYAPGVRSHRGAYTLDRNNPHSTIAQILEEHEDLALPLARQFPAFRKTVVERIIRSAARENALFSFATALPDVVPSLVELPWVIGEFASDTAFLTGNQVRMAFQIAAACGRDVGISKQKAEVLSIVGGAFGWRALARQLVGKIPFGGGLIAKTAIAYAGTVVVGKGLEYLYHANTPLPRELRRRTYREAFEHGKRVAAELGAGQEAGAVK
ncbi:MAG TPA: hypothetical protein VKU19_27755 [Bryobacteraceae bacterium]|nr:hypothetical protein [Bryobacteraceae bacterium]